MNYCKLCEMPLDNFPVWVGKGKDDMCAFCTSSWEAALKFLEKKSAPTLTIEELMEAEVELVEFFEEVTI